MKTQLDNANESDRRLLCNEYKMFPEQVERDIDILMHWINKTPHLPTLPKNKEGEVRNWLENLCGPPEDGIPSKTKVMVANLPYDLSEEKLKELFAAYEPVSAKIALRPIPRFMVKKLQARNEPRKGRGFGFVTLGSEELQQKAVEEMNGKEIEGREIAVKVAIDSPGKEDDVNATAAATEETPAEEAAAPAEENAAPAA